jgi:sulfur carrier protein ThiS
MKLKIKVFGTLTERFPNYDHEKGIDVEISDGARVKDLLDHLKISEPEPGIVVAEGRVRGDDEELQGTWTVDIFQSIFGG